MILVDKRDGSRELDPYLKALSLKTELTMLPSADFAFSGNGPEGVLWKIGIERKTIGDLIQSMNSGRLSDGQLPALQTDYNEVYLFIEGAMRRSQREEGMLEYSMDGMPWTTGYGKAMSWFAVWNYLGTMEDCGLRLRFPYSKKDTAAMLASIYQRRQVGWDDHDSHLAVKKVLVARRAGNVARVARALHIGHTGARRAEAAFPTVHDFIIAGAEKWLETGVVGSKGTATKLERAIRWVEAQDERGKKEEK